AGHQLRDRVLGADPHGRGARATREGDRGARARRGSRAVAHGRESVARRDRALAAHRLRQGRRAGQAGPHGTALAVRRRERREDHAREGSASRSRSAADDERRRAGLIAAEVLLLLLIVVAPLVTASRRLHIPYPVLL